MGKKRRHESLFFLASPCSVLISRPHMPPLDYHRSSFLFCFFSRVPIQSIFIPPSVPFTAAFISTRSLNLRQLLFSVTLFSLFTKDLTSSFSLPPPVCHPSLASFNLTCLIFPSTAPFPDSFSLPFSAHTHFHSVKCAISPSSLSKALHGPIKFPGLMSFLALHTWSTSNSRAHRSRHGQVRINHVASKNIAFLSLICIESVSEGFIYTYKKSYLYTLSGIGAHLYFPLVSGFWLPKRTTT